LNTFKKVTGTPAVRRASGIST